MTVARKLAYLTLGLICVLLGIIGLLVPVIPGILFLAVAIYLGCKASRRVSRYVDGNPQFREQRRRIDGFARLGAADRLKLAGWMLLDTTVHALQGIATGVERLARYAGRRFSGG